MTSYCLEVMLVNVASFGLVGCFCFVLEATFQYKLSLKIVTLFTDFSLTEKQNIVL